MSTYRGVAPPGVLLSPRDLSWWKKGADAALAAVLPLLDDLTDDTPCILDHHGYCQEHWGGATAECSNRLAREFLAQAAPAGSVWRATIADPYLYWCKDHRPAIAVQEVALADIHPSVIIQCTHCGVTVR